MKPRPSSMPVFIQVAALAALAVIASQAVAFCLVVFAPEPRPAGFSIAAAAAALKGEPAQTSDGRALKRRISDKPVEGVDDPMGLAVSAVLAQRMDVPRSDVRIAMSRAEGPMRRRAGPPPPHDGGPRGFVFMRETEGSPPAKADGVEPKAKVEQETVTTSETRSIQWRLTDVPRIEAEAVIRSRTGEPTVMSVDSNTRHVTIMADQLTFAPFTASLRLEDGRWATVEPPRDLLSPWQGRILLGLLISMALLAPLVWWMARRLARPIQVFADAAERLGANPDAEPLSASGPAEVRTAIHAFNDMQASLKRHVSNRTQTIAAIAHDLRTPLTRLRFRVEQAPAKVRDKMAADIEEMDALIGQAMAFVRGEADREARESFDLAGLTRDCVAGFAETGAKATFGGDATLPVHADPAALRRAVDNLVGNAVKFGGGARVSAAREGDLAVIRVEDDGPGLPDDELEAVFEPFHRGERSRNRETGGAGLGLAVARQAARAHGGDVTLENPAGGGLSARLLLPITQA